MTEQLDRSQFTSRYLFQGKLVMETPLHIGTGREVSTLTDSPIMRDAAGRPVIPGSSFKGSFRTAVERLAPLLGDRIRSCHLFDEEQSCLSPQKSKLGEAYRTVREYLGRTLPLEEEEAWQLFRNEDQAPSLAPETPITENEHLLYLLDRHLCHTCRLFGSPYLAAKTYFDDLPVDPKSWFEITEVRDGVGLDRDSERAVPNIKFDYEVVPAQTQFQFSLTVESPTELELGLVAVGLQEFSQGMVRLGGIKSRGLGKCHLELSEIAFLKGRAGLLKYLQKGELETRTGTEIGQFLQESLALFTAEEAKDA